MRTSKAVCRCGGAFDKTLANTWQTNLLGLWSMVARSTRAHPSSLRTRDTSPFFEDTWMRVMYLEIDSCPFLPNHLGGGQHFADNIQAICSTIQCTMILKISNISLKLLYFITRNVRWVGHNQVKTITIAIPFQSKVLCSAVMQRESFTYLTSNGILLCQWYRCFIGIHCYTLGRLKCVQQWNNDGPRATPEIH